MAAGALAVILFGSMGLTLDMGRIYITKSEAQTWVDAAAMTAALELDGTRDGLNRAATAATSAPGSYRFNTRSFTSPTITFSRATTGPWQDASTAALNSLYARVEVSVPLPMLFLPVVTGTSSGTVAARGTAGQVEKTEFKEGVFPFSPFSHNNIGPQFGLQIGNYYNLKWPNKPGPANACAGEDMVTIAKAQLLSSDERGYIEENSAAVIRDIIINDAQTIDRGLGDIVEFTGGDKGTEGKAIDDRVAQDTDSTSTTYSQYKSGGLGNGRRIVLVPINDGGDMAGNNKRIVGFGGFFISPVPNGGNNSWCAEYIGAYTQGSNNGGVESAGAYVVRLVD